MESINTESVDFFLGDFEIKQFAWSIYREEATQWTIVLIYSTIIVLLSNSSFKSSEL